uniref:Uncharacterized protein n=1 Tax=Steinernema glaseri TaxID=37863 RepID=A0A1I8APV4_9BILA
MWTEKFFGNVQFKRASVLSSIVRICLKPFLLLLSAVAILDICSDEVVVTSMVDEIVSSMVHRSVQPKFMEPGAAKKICDCI